LQDEAIYISANIGITIYPDDADCIDDLRKNRLQLARDLPQALLDKQSVLYYQPIVDHPQGRRRAKRSS